MKEKKKQSLKDVFLPTTPVGWLLMGVGAMVFYAIPFDRIFDLMDKSVGYRIALIVVAFFISVPFYLRLRKKLRKYEESKWD